MNAKLWHVMVDGAWRTVPYEGYAPVNVLVAGVYKRVEFRHVATECDREACVGIPSEGGEVEHTCGPGIGYGCDVPDCVTGD